MTPIPLARRTVLVVIALGISMFVLRSQVSSALVVRGDDFAVRGNASRAAMYYRRALWLDSRNGVAIDRLAFAAIMTHRRKRIAEALLQVREYLRSAPKDPAVLMDRAMAEQFLGEYRRAEGDYAYLGKVASDPRAYTFAGFGALRAGNRTQARAWWNSAIQLDPHYLPAQRALARVP